LEQMISGKRGNGMRNKNICIFLVQSLKRYSSYVGDFENGC